MTYKEVTENLCYYDKRNPDAQDAESIADHNESLKRESKKRGYPVNCSCDNCFYGRTKLANEILKHIKHSLAKQQTQISKTV